jgi:hypothetical protein
VVDKKSNKKIASSIEEHSLYRLVDDELAESHALVTNNGSCNNNNKLHQRYGHLNFQCLSSLTRGLMVIGMINVHENKMKFVRPVK